MIYTDLTKRALALCFRAHKEQVDKSGLPYVFHPFYVAFEMPDEDTTVVALLHDLLEDTEYTADDLRAEGFSEVQITAIECMTHADGEDYESYVARVKQNPVARAVKLKDLEHNSNLERLSPDEIHDAAIERWQKYQRAISALKE